MARDGREQRTLFARAVALLARRDHSRAELSAKLRRGLTEDQDPAEVDRVLDTLERDKLLSDERFARTRTRARAQRFGDVRLRFDLKLAGVEPDQAQAALAALAGTELERARAVWNRRFGALPVTAQERARQARFLHARGFSAETIGKVLRGLPTDE